MSKLEKKTSFVNIWNLLVTADIKMGLYLLKEPPNKKTLLERVYKMTLIRNIIMFHGLMLSTLITTKFKLISVIFCFSLESIYIFLHVTMIMYISKKEIMIKLLKWCEDLYDVEKKFHPVVQKLAETHLMSVERQTTKALKFVYKFMYGECFIVTFGFLFLELVLPESILPKYTPFAPFYLPFKNQDNWTAFLVTMLIQTIVCFDVGTMAIYGFTHFFTIIFHILGYLDLINEVAKQMGTEMSIQSKNTFEVAKKTKSKLDINLLESINNSLDNNNKVSFDEWMKILTEMISDVSSISSLLSKFYSMTFLSLEFSCIASLFICGLIFIIVRQQYVFGIGLTIAVLTLWVICFINEKILDKFKDIKATLYDIPWYDLEPKQTKILLIALNCDEIQKGFAAAAIHKLSMERFGIVVKAGYTNLLVLRDLIQK